MDKPRWPMHQGMGLVVNISYPDIIAGHYR